MLVFDFEVIPNALALAHVDSTLLVALVSAADDMLLPAAVECGVRGFLVRGELDPQELQRCLDTVIAGARWYPIPRRAAAVFGRTVTNRLTAREVAVLRMLADGGRTTEIARSLSYSERMVKNIVHDVMTKMDCRTRAQAVAVVVREGVI